MTNSLHRVVSMVLAIVLVSAALAQAQTFTTLYNFTGGSDGGNPSGNVIQDQGGDLYGATYYGGANGYGAVYELKSGGTETVLYSFCSQKGCVDGWNPNTPLARDKAGNIYGTTIEGGSGGNGTVFRIDTAGNETVLHSFGSFGDCFPRQGLLRDKAGNLYGTTDGCSSSQYGTIFRVDNVGNFKLRHRFTGYPSDGLYPQYGRLMMDRSGNLYGVTGWGGAFNQGVLYKLSKSGTFALLHSFAGGVSDGCFPNGSVVQDEAGNLYGTTLECGSNNHGTIWKVSRKGKETILHSFAGGPTDACKPWSGLTRDSKGNLYGVTQQCGTNGYGALYKLSPKSKLTLLQSFDNADGAYPYGEVLRTTKGTLFGTTPMGGIGSCYKGLGCGTVWSYVP